MRKKRSFLLTVLSSDNDQNDELYGRVQPVGKNQASNFTNMDELKEIIQDSFEAYDQGESDCFSKQADHPYFPSADETHAKAKKPEEK